MNTKTIFTTTSFLFFSVFFNPCYANSTTTLTAINCSKSWLVLFSGSMLAFAFTLFYLTQQNRKERNNNRILSDKIDKLESQNKSLHDINQLLESQNTNFSKQNKKLHLSNQSLEQFAYVTSHDLKDPLRSISCYAGLLKRKYLNELGPEAQEYCDYIVDSSKRMYQLLNDIMNYSRLQKNDETADKILVDTNNAVNQAVLNLKTEIEKNEAQIQVVNQLPKVRGNETQMVQLFQNLISNAIKFRNGKAPNIKIDCQVLNNNYTFVVEDNGIGIPAAYHDKVFEVFKQANNQHTHKGHGIGLSICNNIVQQMDGKMWLHSKEGKGTKFYFSLPEQQSSN